MAGQLVLTFVWTPIFVSLVLVISGCSTTDEPRLAGEANQDPAQNSQPPLRREAKQTPRQNSQPLKTENDCAGMPFRCLVAYDAQHSSVVRHVEVVLEQRAFSEHNLKLLFKQLSKKYADSIFLVIIVNTRLGNNLPPSFELDSSPGTGTSGNSSNIEEYTHYIAKYYRRDGTEFFTYTPTLRNGIFRDVIIRGKKIYRNAVWWEPKK